MKDKQPECCKKHSDTCCITSVMAHLCCNKCPYYRESWEWEFEKLSGESASRGGFMLSCENCAKNVKSFIKSLLVKEKKALLEGLLRKEKTWGGYNGEEIVDDKEALGYNQAVQEQNRKIKDMIKGL
ncbi:MAG TPA: hypothetical protein ENI23_08760 [bacterium]|nr:hypothetical protein [bacterium]